jgi:hypothetical protein
MEVSRRSFIIGPQVLDQTFKIWLPRPILPWVHRQEHRAEIHSMIRFRLGIGRSPGNSGVPIIVSQFLPGHWW